MRYTNHSVDIEDLKRLWKAFPACYRALHQFAFWQALRAVDCRRLLLEDLNLDEGYFWLRKQKNGTLDEKVPLFPEAIQVLRAWIIQRGVLSHNLLFCNTRGHRISPITWYMAVRSARTNAGVDGGIYRFSRCGRMLRRLTGHSAKVVRMQMAEAQGLDIRELQALGHHRNYQTTMIYLSNPTENYPLKLRVLRKLSNKSSILGNQI